MVPYISHDNPSYYITQFAELTSSLGSFLHTLDTPRSLGLGLFGLAEDAVGVAALSAALGGLGFGSAIFRS
jgi:hypothetical protein